MENIFITNRLNYKLTSVHEVRVNGKSTFLGYNQETIFNGLKQPNWGNYFDLKNNGKLTFTAGEGCPKANERGKWISEGRQDVKPSKLIEYLLNNGFWGFGKYVNDQICFDYDVKTEIESKAFKNRAIEVVANALKPEQILLASEMGKTVSEIYEMDCNGFTSCMANKSYPQMYNDIDACDIAYIIKDGIIQARAIVWKAVKYNGEQFTFIDRIYNDNYIQQFKEFATDKGFYSKVTNSYDTNTLELNNDTITSYFVKLDPCVDPTDGSCPWLDTLKFYNSELHRLQSIDSDADYKLQSTCGEAEPINNYICYHCGESIDEGDVIYDVDGNTACRDCVTYCDYCNEYHYIDNTSYSSILYVSYCNNCQSEHVEALLDRDRR